MFGAPAPPSIRKTVLYFLTGALLVGAPVLILTKYVYPAIAAVLYWLWSGFSGRVPIVLSKL